MITITDSAATQIKEAKKHIDENNMLLIVAATRDDDGNIEYGMGFGEGLENAQELDCNGITVLVSLNNKELLDGLTIDYVELNPGEFSFIFINPNDPRHTSTPSR